MTLATQSTPRFLAADAAFTPASPLDESQRRLLDMILTSGGDERIAIDPLTGRNRYGVPRGLAENEVWFSTSTAAAVSPRGYAAATRAWALWTGPSSRAPLSAWFDNIRARLLALFGAPGAQAVLTGSGTETELVVAALARHLLERPIVSIVTAPGETGSGVVVAAGARHFLGSTAFCASVAPGERLDGFGAKDMRVASAAIRDADGALLPPDVVDAAIATQVEAALRDGDDVVLHVLDCSKTGRAGLRRRAAAALMTRAPGRVLVVVDACQLRLSDAQIRADLRAGFMVMITGSKFAGGPSFSGALLIPPGLVARLRGFTPPRGLAAYSAVCDWPVALRDERASSFDAEVNLGLALRWEAALAELEGYFALDEALRAAVAMRFVALARAHVATTRGLALIDEGEGGLAGEIVPIVAADDAGRPLDANALRAALRRTGGSHARGPDRAFHLGQPVAVGGRAALRLCLSAPQVVDVGQRMRAGLRFDAAFATLADDLADLFEKWERVLAAPAGDAAA